MGGAVRRPLNVCICGGGNAAHVLAADLGARPKDFIVSIFAGFADEAEKFRSGLAVTGGTVTRVLRGKETVGKVDPARVSNKAADVIPEADVVLLPVPSFADRGILTDIGPHLHKEAVVVAMPGQGGFQWLTHQILGDARAHDMVIAGLSQLPYQCRTSAYGQRVDLIGHKQEVGVGVIPADKGPEVAAMLSDLIGVTRITPLSSYMEVTLYPANQCIHPAVMYGLFKDYKAGEVLKEKPLFYGSVTPEVADHMQALSDDFMAVTRALGPAVGVDLSHVPSVGDMMRRFYGSEIADPSTLSNIFLTNEGYKGLTAPCKAVDGGYVPDFDYRYLTEDIPNGLCVIKGLAVLVGCPTPTLDKTVVWAQSVMRGGKYKFIADDGHSLGPDFFTATQTPQCLLNVTTVEQLRDGGYV